MNGVYLIHFSRPFGHARHYLGSAKDIDARVAHHQTGSGARLLRHVNNAGISWEVVRVWAGHGRELERRLKSKGSTRLCPVCNPDNWDKFGNPDPNEARRNNPNRHAVRDDDGRFMRRAA